jgi:tryptophan halogenase
MEIPDSLAHKMELFRERAKVVTYKDGLFLEPSWLAVYFGQRIMPRAYNPLADAISAADLDARLAGVSNRVRDAVTRMPTHEEFLAEYCPAAPPRAAMGARS